MCLVWSGIDDPGRQRASITLEIHGSPLQDEYHREFNLVVLSTTPPSFSLLASLGGGLKGRARS